MFSLRFGRKQSNQATPAGAPLTAGGPSNGTAPICDDPTTAINSANLLSMQNAGAGNTAALACIEQQQEEGNGYELQLGPASDERKGGVPFFGRGLLEEVLGYEESSLRSQLQRGTPTAEEVATDPAWTELIPWFVGSHDNGDDSPERKYVHSSGREAIVDGATGEVIDDPEIGGTFNYINPRNPTKELLTNPLERARFIGQNVGHGVLDLAPHVLPRWEQTILGNELDSAATANGSAATLQPSPTQSDREPTSVDRANAVYSESLHDGNTRLGALWDATKAAPGGIGLMFLEGFAESELEPLTAPMHAASAAAGMVPHRGSQLGGDVLGYMANGVDLGVGKVAGNQDKQRCATMGITTDLVLQGIETAGGLKTADHRISPIYWNGESVSQTGERVLGTNGALTAADQITGAAAHCGTELEHMQTTLTSLTGISEIFERPFAAPKE